MWASAVVEFELPLLVTGMWLCDLVDLLEKTSTLPLPFVQVFLQSIPSVWSVPSSFFLFTQKVNYHLLFVSDICFLFARKSTRLRAVKFCTHTPRPKLFTLVFLVTAGLSMSQSRGAWKSGCDNNKSIVRQHGRRHGPMCGHHPWLNVNLKSWTRPFVFLSLIQKWSAYFAIMVPFDQLTRSPFGLSDEVA